MGDLKVGVGGSDFPQIQLNPKAAEATGPKITGPHVPRTRVPKQAENDSNITPQALAARTAEVKTARRSQSVKPGIKADTEAAPNVARQQNAKTIAARVVAYGSDVDSSIKHAGAFFTGTIKDHTDRCSGYLNRLAETPITINDRILPADTGDKAVERARIQVIYDQAYSVGDPSQAQKSATEISGTLQQAVPKGVIEGAYNLGNIGEPLSMQAADFNDAKTKLEAFANAIFNDPSCDGLYSPVESKDVKDLVINKALEYAEAAHVDVNKAMQLVRDNLIKIHHQQTVDHRVISGSDHGVRHVVQSNVKHTLNALDDQQLNGLVSPKDKLMAMQIMIDHDLGYTLDAAKGDFGAAKDHPLASAAYLELGRQNSAIFSPEEQAYMRDAVLKHSYPFDLSRPLDFHTGGKENAIADLISVIDAMGVTGDTKCPAIFREAKFFDTLSALVEINNDWSRALEDQNALNDLITRMGDALAHPENLSQKERNNFQGRLGLLNAVKTAQEGLEAVKSNYPDDADGIKAAKKGLDDAIKSAKDGITKEFETDAREIMHSLIQAKMESGAISSAVAGRLSPGGRPRHECLWRRDDFAAVWREVTRNGNGIRR
ncbi:MAG: hypothetical protein LBR92_01850 [Puniceicoccales bacterium]|jgi:hypothetical protein|nr:hypothetical protein [Puniceicoccales bacterium]